MYHIYYVLEPWNSNHQQVEAGQEGGLETGRVRAGDGREAGGDGVGCGSHARAAGVRRMRDVKFYDDFLGPFLSYQKSELKNIDYLLF